MDRTASFMRKLEEIAREYELPLRGIELVKSRMCWEDWHGLRKEGVIFAREELRKRKWRGAHGGVRPGCGDAEDIVDEAIGQMLEGKCRAGLGGGRERLSKELKRLLSRVYVHLRERPTQQKESDALCSHILLKASRLYAHQATTSGISQPSAPVFNPSLRDFPRFLGRLLVARFYRVYQREMCLHIRIAMGCRRSVP